MKFPLLGHQQDLLNWDPFLKGYKDLYGKSLPDKFYVKEPYSITTFSYTSFLFCCKTLIFTWARVEAKREDSASSQWNYVKSIEKLINLISHKKTMVGGVNFQIIHSK